MELSIVFPMFWGREKREIVQPGDYFYDHPTALDDEGTIPQLFESMQVLKDRNFNVIAVAGANHPSLAGRVEQQAKALLEEHASRAGVELHFFSYSHLEKLHRYLEGEGKSELKETIGLVGYSPLRNACLVAAHVLGSEVAVSIDDDCLFIEPSHLERIRENMLSDFEGRPILAYCGPYLTPADSITLERPTAPWTVHWNVIEIMNETFRRHILDAPGMKEVHFAIMGNIAVHRDFFSRIPLDPPMRRGEDMDWVMNAHILGERFVMDTELTIRHDPPPRPYPAWRPLREDIYRFRYQRAKIDMSRDGDGYHRLDRDRYLPYPGRFFQDDFVERASKACSLLAMDYLAKGQKENAQEALNNIYHAHVLATPEGDPFQDYLAFQAKWEVMMDLIAQDRDRVRKMVFPEA